MSAVVENEVVDAHQSWPMVFRTELRFAGDCTQSAGVVSATERTVRNATQLPRRIQRVVLHRMETAGWTGRVRIDRAVSLGDGTVGFTVEAHINGNGDAPSAADFWHHVKLELGLITRNPRPNPLPPHQIPADDATTEPAGADEYPELRSAPIDKQYVELSENDGSPSEAGDQGEAPRFGELNTGDQNKSSEKALTPKPPVQGGNLDVSAISKKVAVPEVRTPAQAVPADADHVELSEDDSSPNDAGDQGDASGAVELKTGGQNQSSEKGMTPEPPVLGGNPDVPAISEKVDAPEVRTPAPPDLEKGQPVPEHLPPRFEPGANKPNSSTDFRLAAKNAEMCREEVESCILVWDVRTGEKRGGPVLIVREMGEDQIPCKTNLSSRLIGLETRCGGLWMLSGYHVEVAAAETEG